MHFFDFDCEHTLEPLRPGHRASLWFRGLYRHLARKIGQNFLVNIWKCNHIPRLIPLGQLLKALIDLRKRDLFATSGPN